MNYLAHAFLSFGIPEITVGNLVSDFVKGRKRYDFPQRIQQGISLHRAIDDFTDTHPVNRRARVIFKEVYGLYSGPIIDVVYDHFLANDPVNFAGSNQLADLAQKTYTDIAAWQSVLPERFARMFHYMRAQNWLLNYREREGLYNSLHGLARRAAYMGDAGRAIQLFETGYDELAACYTAFFPELKDFTLRKLEQLQQDAGGGPPAGT